MASTIQDILHRIEKLKTSLQEKNATLEEREHAVADMTARLAAAEKRNGELEREVEELKVKAGSAGPAKSEAFMAAERVEVITNLQREMQKARDEVRALKAQLRDAGKATVDSEQAPAKAGSHQDSEDMRHRIHDHEREIISLTEQVDTMKLELLQTREKMTAAQTRAAKAEEAVREAQAARQAQAAEVTAGPSGEFDSEMESVVSTQQLQIAELMERLGDSDEKDRLITTQMLQIAEFEDEVGRLRQELEARLRKVRDMESEIAERDAILSEQMRQIEELTSQDETI